MADHDEWILAIDNGTQSLKALIYGLSGELIAKEQVAFVKPYVSEAPGWAEQDPDYYWQALCQACRSLWNDPRVSRARIAGMAVTTQRGTVISVGKDGVPLRPAMVWLDQRRTHGLLPIGGLWGTLFRAANLTDTVSYLQAEAEANWIRTYQPEVWRNTRKYLLLSGYLTYKLTGEYMDSVGCQVGYIPFDYKRLKWCAGWNWKWKAAPVDPEWLPDLVMPGQVLGHISKGASEETGLPVGLPIIAAAADKACEVIGTGSLSPSIGCLSYGTTATINVTHKKYMEAIRLLPAYPSAVPGYHSMEVQVYRGYWMLNWFKEEFGYREQREASEKGLRTEELFDRLIATVPPGSMGLMLQPYWTPGLRKPGPEAKGAIIGFGDIHSRAHLLRSIMEGLAYALREGKERIEKRTRVPVTSLRVSGGGSQSSSALQLTADIFGLPTAKPHVYETSGLGAAIDAAVGLGLYPGFREAVDGMTHVGKVYEPDVETHQLYTELYQQVYLKMYGRLKPFYRKIRDITGYPK